MHSNGHDATGAGGRTEAALSFLALPSLPSRHAPIVAVPSSMIMPGLPDRISVKTVDHFACATMHGALARRTCTGLLPLRSFLLRQASTALQRDVTETGRCFGGRQPTLHQEQRQSITTCFAAKTAPSGTALASGDYGAEQIQVLDVTAVMLPVIQRPELSRCLLKCSPR